MEGRNSVTPNDTFSCPCGGDVRVIAPDYVLHKCLLKDNPGYYCRADATYQPWKRIQVSPKITQGTLKYNWFADWQ